MPDELWEKNVVEWRCKRGLWELDLLLQHFFYAKFDALTTKDRESLQWLLVQHDPYLQRVLVYKQEDKTLKPSVKKIIEQIIDCYTDNLVR